MKKHLTLLLAGALILTSSCGGGSKSSKQQPEPEKNVVENVEVNVGNNVGRPSNLSDLLENYMGTFEGITPEKNDIKLTLNADYTYSLTVTHTGKNENPFESTGKWTIDENVDIVTLELDKPELAHYKIIDNNTIQLLNKDAKPISESHNYYLTK